MTTTTHTPEVEDGASPSPASVVMASMRSARESLSVRRVFGHSYATDGVTVIPVAAVAGRAGGGGGEGPDSVEPGRGFGTGFGLQANPVGVFEIHEGKVSWKPSVDVTRLVHGGQVLAGIAIVCCTLVRLRRPR